jgi:hypothetical protein
MTYGAIALMESPREGGVRGTRYEFTRRIDFDKEDYATYLALLSEWRGRPSEGASQNDGRKKYDVPGIKADQAISFGQEPLFTWLHTCFGQR